MMRCLVGAVIALALLMAAPSVGADGSAVCAERQRIAETLRRELAEQPVAVGLSAEGLMIEVFAAASGSFTIVVTRPDGLSCVLVTGEGWTGAPGGHYGQPA